eukprot:712049-Pelagomonas_calceolata.AAC.5
MGSAAYRKAPHHSLARRCVRHSPNVRAANYKAANHIQDVAGEAELRINRTASCAAQTCCTQGNLSKTFASFGAQTRSWGHMSSALPRAKGHPGACASKPHSIS